MSRSLGRAALAAATVAALTAASAVATDYPQDALKLLLRSGPTGSKAVYVTKVPSIALPSSAPFLVGATFTIKSQSGETATFDLPGAYWTTNGPGTLYKFSNPAAPAGPSEVKVALIKAGSVLKVTAKSSGITLDEPAQESVTVTFAVGDDRWCSTCGLIAIRADEPGKFIARGCAAVPCGSPSPAFIDD